MSIIIAWKPAQGIVGFNTGIATWSSKFNVVKVTTSNNNNVLTLPGSGWMPVTLPMPTLKDIVYSFKFVGIANGKEVSPTYINVPVYKAPLIISSWTPASSYNPMGGARNYLGFLSYYTVGAVSLSADGKPLKVSNNTITRIPWTATYNRWATSGSIQVVATSVSNFKRTANVNWKLG